MILSRQSIRRLCEAGYLVGKDMVEPTQAFGRSYGLSSCSYDIRVAQTLVISPGKGILGSALEYLRMPSSVVGFVKDKSSNARDFILVQNTLIDPGWKGYLTLEITNHGKAPVEIEAGTPIAQIVFQWLDFPTDLPYDGKYQNQGSQPQPTILK